MKKLLLIAICILLGFVFYKIGQAHKRLPGLLREAVDGLNLEEKGLELSFEKVSVTFVSSLTHPFGLRLKNLQLKHSKKCSGYNLEIERMILPVKVLPLYRAKNIDLGMIRLTDAKLVKMNLCRSTTDDDRVEVSMDPESKIIPKSELQAEKVLLLFFKKIKDLNAKFLKQELITFTYKGALVYDLHFEFPNQNKIYVNRFKFLRGSGELKYKAEWSSILTMEDSKVAVKGELVGYNDRLEAEVFFKEKESVLKASILSLTDLNKSDKVILNFKSVPLSHLSKIRDADFAGLNLRKTWLDSVLELDISGDRLELAIKDFRIYGDFGLIETDANSPHLEWRGENWALMDSVQLKFHKINFFEILADRPQKKIAQVFKDVGNFNALVKLNSLQEFSGDFETNNFSVSLRSRGRKAYQKIKFARGSLYYKKEQQLVFNLEDVGLENGDFEGLIVFAYDYQRKEISTNFDVQDLKFDPRVTKSILGLAENAAFSFKGKGFISKQNLTKLDRVDARSDLKFELGSPMIKTEHWTGENLSSSCRLNDRSLTCDLFLARLILSDKLQRRLQLSQNSLIKVESTSFVFKDKVLKAGLKSTNQRLNFDWSSKVGMVFSSPKTKKVQVRKL